MKVSNLPSSIMVKQGTPIVVLFYLAFFFFFECEKSPSVHKDCGAAWGVGGVGWVIRCPVQLTFNTAEVCPFFELDTSAIRSCQTCVFALKGCTKSDLATYKQICPYHQALLFKLKTPGLI